MADKQYDFSDFDESNYDFSDFESTPSEPQEMSKLESFGRGAKRGATFNMDDELAGVVDALTANTPMQGKMSGFDMLANPITPLALMGNKAKELIAGETTWDDIKNNYYKGQQESQNLLEKAKTDNPYSALLGELTGGFVIPAGGAVKAAGKGVSALRQAGTLAASGAAAGGLASGAGYVGDTKLEDMSLADAGKQIGIGATVGGALGTAGAAIGGVGKYIANSELGQDIVKIFGKSKQGIQLSGPEQAKMFNAGLLDESGKIVDNVIERVEQLELEYAQRANALKVGKPEQAQKQIDDLMEEIVKTEIAGSNKDPRILEAKIKQLQKDEALTADEIASIYDSIAAKKAGAKNLQDTTKFNKMNEGAQQIEQKASTDLDRVTLERQKLELQIEKRQASKSDKIDLQQQIDEIDRQLNTKKGQKIGQSRDISVGNKRSDIVNKARKDIAGDVSGEQLRLRELQNQNADLNKQIVDTVALKRATTDQGVDSLFQQLEKLKTSVPEASYQQLKDANLSRVKSISENMGREDIANKVRNIVKDATPGAQEVDDLIKKKYQDLANLGMSSTDNTAKNIKKTDDVINNLVDSFKAAGKNDTNSSSNKLNAAQAAFGNKKIDAGFSKAKELAENYNLNQKLDKSSWGSPIYRGADVAGKVSASVGKGIDKVNKAIDRLPGGSALRQKLVDITKLEPEAQTRAIYTLSQQPWFREVTKDNENNK
jgi:hypothetical protein